MAGNKGRGRAAYTFNIEAVGFSRGDKLPDVVLKPPPLFPDTDYKPVPLKTGESEDYVLALKQELRETVKRMPYFVETPEEKQDIERYSKRYMKVYKEEWIPDWRRLPRELMPRKKCKKAVEHLLLPAPALRGISQRTKEEPSSPSESVQSDGVKTFSIAHRLHWEVREGFVEETQLNSRLNDEYELAVMSLQVRCPVCHTTLLDAILKGKDIQYTIAVIQKCVTSGFTSAGTKSKKAEDAGKGPSLTNPVDVLKKIEELEKKGEGEKSDEENEEKEGGKEKSKEGDDDEEDDAAEQEEYDEEEQEEENDYINSYFEDGDDFGADSDDNMDEATY